MLLYLVATTGVTISAHFCEGTLSSFSINPFDSQERCSCGSKKMKKDCCKDETTNIKLDENQQKSPFIFCNVVDITGTQPFVSGKRPFHYQVPILSLVFAYSTHPPDGVKHPLYMRYSVFQI